MSDEAGSGSRTANSNSPLGYPHRESPPEEVIARARHEETVNGADPDWLWLTSYNHIPVSASYDFLF